MRATIAILFAIACVSCSKADVNKTSSDLKAAAADIKHDPAVKKLGQDVKVAAKDTGAELKKGASKAKVELTKAGTQLKHSAAKAGDEVKQETHEAKEKASS